MTTGIGIKFIIETSAKERYQQLLELITIDVLKIEWQHPPSNDIINIPMNPIINSYFNKHPMSWEIIHLWLIYPSDSFMKAMCRYQFLYGLPKHCNKKIHKAPCTICFIEERKLSTRSQQLTPVTFKKENLFTWTLNFTT